MIRLLLLLFVCFLISVTSAFAQDMEVVEQCITDFREPPDDWTFDGTIITYGYDGLYGFRSDIASRYFIDFSSTYLRFGSFSPDGQWFAYYSGYSHPNNLCCNVSYNITSLEVISTQPTRERYSIPFSSYKYTINLWLQPPQWLSDNTRFLAYADGVSSGWYLVEPFEGNVNKLTDENLQEFEDEDIIIHEDLSLLDHSNRFASVNSHIFLADSEHSKNKTIHVMNEDKNIIQDTCLENHFAYAVSPAENQVAISSQEGGFVYVVDLDEWVAYRLDLAANHVVAWVADD